MLAGTWKRTMFIRLKTAQVEPIVVARVNSKMVVQTGFRRDDRMVKLRSRRKESSALPQLTSRILSFRLYSVHFYPGTASRIFAIQSPFHEAIDQELAIRVEVCLHLGLSRAGMAQPPPPCAETIQETRHQVTSSILVMARVARFQSSFAQSRCERPAAVR